MQNNNKTIWLFIIILIIIVVIFFVGQLQQSLKLSQDRLFKNRLANSENQLPLLTADNPRLGNPQANLIIFEYSDYFCPHCQQANQVNEQILKNYQEKVLFVWKDAPRDNQSVQAAKSARCAQQQEKFWPYHDLLFVNQDKLNEAFYLQAATDLNLDLNKFQQCLASDAVEQLIDADLTEFNSLINIEDKATPYYFIGTTRVSGYLDYQEFINYLEEELIKT